MRIRQKKQEMIGQCISSLFQAVHGERFAFDCRPEAALGWGLAPFLWLKVAVEKLTEDFYRFLMFVICWWYAYDMRVDVLMCWMNCVSAAILGSRIGSASVSISVLQFVKSCETQKWYQLQMFQVQVFLHLSKLSVDSVRFFNSVQRLWQPSPFSRFIRLLCAEVWRRPRAMLFETQWLQRKKMGRFLKWGYPRMDGSWWKSLLKWMIWGYPYFRKPPCGNIWWLLETLRDD